jgi:nucleotide-binding universal stress UspA family protein
MSETAAQVRRPFTVVVGVSSTSRSPAALRWAVQEAAHHDGVVIALRAWRPPRPPAAVGAKPPTTSWSSSALAAQAQEELESDVAHVLGNAHDVECRLVKGGRRKALRAVSRYADLLVIDAPQRTDLTSPPLFARRLIYSARCPVVVIPPAVAEQLDTPLVAAGKRIGSLMMEAAGTAGKPGLPPTPRSKPHDNGATV